MGDDGVGGGGRRSGGRVWFLAFDGLIGGAVFGSVKEAPIATRTAIERVVADHEVASIELVLAAIAEVTVGLPRRKASSVVHPPIGAPARRQCGIGSPSQGSTDAARTTDRTQELGLEQMTRRPRTVSGAAAPGRIAMPLVPTVLLADADADAREMVRDALLEGTGPCDLRTVATVRELEEYLDAPQEDVATPPPCLILIDLELPDTRTGGIDAVRAIKSDPALRRVPVVVLARRPEPDQIAAAYDAGANTVIPKPVTFLALVKLMKVFTAYWLEAAALPHPGP